MTHLSRGAQRRARPLLPLLIALALTAPGLAAAGEPKSERATHRRAVKPIEAPPASTDNHRRADAIAMLHALIERGDQPIDTLRTMRLRLASLQLDEAEARADAGMAIWEGQFDACFAATDCDAEAMTPFRPDEALFREAERHLNDIVAESPASEDAARAGVMMGELRLTLGEPDGARAALTRVVRDHPGHADAPRAWLRLGDLAFERNEVLPAIRAYRKALRTLEGDLGDHARRQLAWALYNVGSEDEALTELERLIDGALTRRDAAGDPATGAMLDEALQDAARFAAGGGDHERVVTLLRRHGQAHRIPALLDATASGMQGRGEIEAAVATWANLLAIAPAHRDAPSWWAAQVETWVAAGRLEQAQAAMGRMERETRPASAWGRAHTVDPSVQSDARAQVEKTLRRTALAWHEECRKRRHFSPSCKAALDGYTLHAASFADSTHAADVDFGRAELLYATGEYRAAWGHYMAVVQRDPKGSHARFCAEAAIHAARQLQPPAPNGTRPGVSAPIPEAHAPRALNREATMLLDAADQLARLWPDDAETHAALYEAGYLLYAHDQFAEAARRFRAVIAKAPQSKEAERAAHLILDALALVEDWPALRDTAAVFLASDRLGGRRFRAEIASIHARASFQTVAEAHPPAEAGLAGAEAWFVLTQSFPNDEEIASKALFNAALAWDRGRDTRRAAEARTAWLARWPQGERAGDIRAALAQDLEDMGDFAPARDAWRELADHHPAHPDAADGRYSAMLLSWALGDIDPAVAQARRFVADHADDPRAAEVALDTGRMLAEAGRAPEAAGAFEALAKDEGASASHRVRAAALHLSALPADAPAREPAERWVLSLASAAGDANESSRRAAASVHLNRLQRAVAQLDALALTGPTRHDASMAEWNAALGSQLRTRRDALQHVEALVQTVLATGVAATAQQALVEQGGARARTAQVLRDAPSPPSSALNSGRSTSTVSTTKRGASRTAPSTHTTRRSSSPGSTCCTERPRGLPCTQRQHCVRKTTTYPSKTCQHRASWRKYWPRRPSKPRPDPPDVAPPVRAETTRQRAPESIHTIRVSARYTGILSTRMQLMRLVNMLLLPNVQPLPSSNVFAIGKDSWKSGSVRCALNLSRKSRSGIRTPGSPSWVLNTEPLQMTTARQGLLIQSGSASGAAQNTTRVP
jgi:cellulose synthase operon protein C